MQCQQETKGRQVMLQKGFSMGGRHTTDSHRCRNKATYCVSLYAGDMLVCWFHAQEAKQAGLAVAALKLAGKE